MSKLQLFRETIKAQLTSELSIKSVDLSNEGLTEFPEELLAVKDTVEFINFGGNRISSLPTFIKEFHKLRILFFAQNNFTSIPVELGSLSNLYMLSFKGNQLENIPEDSLSPSLKWLILTDNKLKTLPPSIGRLSGLRKLMLSGNQLESLPEELSNCHELELARFAVNKLSTIPDWLLKLPKLAWIAFSGNNIQFNQTAIKDSHCPLISWDSVQVLEKLGEGASGAVYKTKIEIEGKTQDMALKVFKGAITSDGVAEDEISANLAVGLHNNFIPIQGKIKDHPEGEIAIVFPLLEQGEYSILGNPPTFDSITRDSFPPDKKFPKSFILNAVKGIADACAHLSANGLVHGDLYAHNILTTPEGFPLLTDFGASSLLHEFSQESKVLLEKVEVRAFGNLIEDLILNVDNDEDIGSLRQLITQCQSKDQSERPTFDAISQTLNKF